MNAGHVPGTVVRLLTCHIIHSPRVTDTVYYSLHPAPRPSPCLDEGFLAIVLLWMRKLRLGLHNMPSGHAAKGEMREARLVDSLGGRKEACQGWDMGSGT